MIEIARHEACRHEACHGLVARLLGLIVDGVSIGERPICRISWPEAQSAEEQADNLERCAIAGLAGPILEEDPTAKHVLGDLYRAFDLCREIIALREGVPGRRVDQKKVEDLHSDLFERAAALVRANMPAIARIAQCLDDAGELSGGVIDELIENLKTEKTASNNQEG
jgi:hypothetical protein